MLQLTFECHVNITLFLNFQKVGCVYFLRLIIEGIQYRRNKLCFYREKLQLISQMQDGSPHWRTK